MTTEQTRIDEIAAKVADSRENHAVPWQNERIVLSVINLSVDTVLLNPDSHRIKAQIESHLDAREIDADPFSYESQELIAQMLRETLGYNALLESLRESGQIDTGIVTHKGVLINANTRVVAMRELNESHIRVAVLPDSATESEIVELEAKLQLAKDHKQDYTLTNELLFIKEQIDYGQSKEDLAILLGKAQSRSRGTLNKGIAEIDKSIRILQHIREMQAMSSGEIKLTFFDDHESALNEADRAYMALRDRDPAEANRVPDGRMAGVLVGVTYRNLRNWDNDSFVQQYLESRLADEEDIIEALTAHTSVNVGEEDKGFETVDDDGLGVFANQEDEIDGIVDPRNVLTMVAAAYGTEDSAEVAPGITKQEFFGRLEDCITQAAEDREQERRDERKQSTPVRLVKEARQKIVRARESIEGMSGGGPNRGKLDYELRQLRKDYDALVEVWDDSE